MLTQNRGYYLYVSCHANVTVVLWLSLEECVIHLVTGIGLCWWTCIRPLYYSKEICVKPSYAHVMLPQVSALQQSGNQHLGQTTAALQQQQLLQQQLLQQSKQQQQVTQQVGFPFPCGSCIHTNLVLTIMKDPAVEGFLFSFRRCVINLIWPQRLIWPFQVTMHLNMCTLNTKQETDIFNNMTKHKNSIFVSSYAFRHNKISCSYNLLIWSHGSLAVL